MPTDNPTPDPNTPSQSCAACGCTSPLARQFRKAGGAGVLCPRCYVKHMETQQRKFTVTAALALGGQGDADRFVVKRHVLTG